MYDGDDPTSPEDDTNENTSVSGFIGGSLIYTDYWKWYGAYDETDDDTLMRVFTHQWWNWESDPGSDRDKFDYGMGQHVESRGNKFMPHPFNVGAPTFDYRFMLTSGPFDGFSLGDTIRLVYVATVGEGIGGLRQNADNALEAYYAGSESNPYNPSAPNEGTHYLLPVPPPVPVLAYSPMDKGVRLSWDNSAELEIDPLVGAADFEGYRVYRATFNPEGWEMIAAFDNYDGPVNIIDFSTGDTLYDGQLFDLPDLEHSWVDTQTAFYVLGEDGNETALIEDISRPINNLPYYYAVTSYDNPAAHGKPEFPPIESSKTNFKTDPSTGAPIPVYPGKLYDFDEEWDGREVSVYPNPYKGASSLESQYEDKINFTNLPPACKVSIFSLTGDLIISLENTEGRADLSWNLASRTDLDVVSGLYIYVVESGVETYPTIQRGTFVILRGD
jgi:hypothetical protein